MGKGGGGMRYLERFYLPGEAGEYKFFANQRRTCYNSFYPYQIFPEKELDALDFEPVTILYGGNGSGKTTLLNLIAGALGLGRGAACYNKSTFFDAFTAACRAVTSGRFTPEVRARSRIITSDDVFDYLFEIRGVNEGIDEKRDALLSEYTQAKYAQFQMHSLDDYEELKKVVDSRRRTGSQYVKRRLMGNLPGRSNGESAFLYFTHAVEENGLYLLDEPENSLSAANQEKLAAFLSDSARFFGSQLVISTHSPFLLAMEGAAVYDLDEVPVRRRSWTQLPSVRAYHDFFEAHRAEF